MLNNTTDVDIMTGRKLSSFQVANIEILKYNRRDRAGVEGMNRCFSPLQVSFYQRT